MSIYGNRLKENYIEESYNNTEYVLSNGLYGNSLINANDNPLVIASIIESDCREFVRIMNGAGGAKYLLEADENTDDKKEDTKKDSTSSNSSSSKSSFKEKIKNFFIKIKEFIKKIWEKIKGFFRKIKEKIFKKKSTEDKKSDNSSGSTASGTCKISNYLTVFDSLGDYTKKLLISGLLEAVLPFDIDNHMLDIIDGSKTSEEVVDGYNNNVQKKINEFVKSFKTLSIGSSTNGNVKDDISAENLSELSSALSSMSQELFKYINGNQVELEIVDNNGSADFKNPIKTSRRTYDRSFLSSHATIDIEKEKKQIDQFEKELDGMFANVQKDMNRLFNKCISTIEVSVKTFNGTKETGESAREAISTVQGLVNKNLPSTIACITTLVTTSSKLLYGAMKNIESMKTALKI